MWLTGMHKLKNVSISRGANLANSHHGNHQLALIKGLRGVEILESWKKLGWGLTRVLVYNEESKV